MIGVGNECIIEFGMNRAGEFALKMRRLDKRLNQLNELN